MWAAASVGGSLPGNVGRPPHIAAGAVAGSVVCIAEVLLRVIVRRGALSAFNVLRNAVFPRRLLKE